MLLVAFAMLTRSHTACRLKQVKVDITLLLLKKQDQISNKLDHSLTYYSVHHACSNNTESLARHQLPLQCELTSP